MADPQIASKVYLGPPEWILLLFSKLALCPTLQNPLNLAVHPEESVVWFWVCLGAMLGFPRGVEKAA